MDSGFRSLLTDFFRRGEVAADIRMLAARGGLAPRALEQLAILLILVDDPDPNVARTAASTVDALPAGALEGFLARPDVPEPMRAYFAGRGIQPTEGSGDAADEPLVQADEPVAENGATADPTVMATMPVLQRMKLAMRGTREQRGQLIRDSNKLVAAAVLSSPKLTESEVEVYARMANLPEEILRIIASNRAWTKNYNVVAALTRNPKTPIALAMGFLQRLNDRDLKMISIDRNVSEPVRIAARKYVVKPAR